MWSINIIGCAISAIIILLKLLSFIYKIIKKNQDISIKVNDRLREEALDRAILNNATPNELRKIQEATPIAVNYNPNKIAKGKPMGKDSVRSSALANSYMIQLVENSGISEKKYMLNPKQGISIGREPGLNDVVITDSHVDGKQCRIIEYQDKVYIQNIGKFGRVILSRRNKKNYVENNAIELRNKDLLIIGSVLFRVEFIKTKVKSI